jgi:hypothetical protein
MSIEEIHAIVAPSKLVQQRYDTHALQLQL